MRSRLVILSLALAVAGCGSTAKPAVKPVSVPAAVVSSCTVQQPCPVPAPNSCHGDVLPDLRCTPGGINAAYVGSYAFCDPAYRTITDRPPTSYTGPLKVKLLQAYGYLAVGANSATTRAVQARFELDHLIPLTAGGAPSDPRNLWPEPWDGPQGAHVKDKAELALHKLVCANRTGDASLVQGAFAQDWRPFVHGA